MPCLDRHRLGSQHRLKLWRLVPHQAHPSSSLALAFLTKTLGLALKQHKTSTWKMINKQMRATTKPSKNQNNTQKTSTNKMTIFLCIYIRQPLPTRGSVPRGGFPLFRRQSPGDKTHQSKTHWHPHWIRAQSSRNTPNTKKTFQIGTLRLKILLVNTCSRPLWRNFPMADSASSSADIPPIAATQARGGWPNRAIELEISKMSEPFL